MKVSEDVQHKLSEIDRKCSKYRDEQIEIIKKHADSSSPYEVGDILEDHWLLGMVLSINHDISPSTHSYNTFYTCKRLTQKLKPYKNNEIVRIYLCNVKNKLL